MKDNTVKDSKGNTVDVYIDNMDSLLDQYANEKGGLVVVDKEGNTEWQPLDLYAIDQQRWNAVLIYIYNNMFKNTVSKKYNCIIDYSDIDTLNDVCDKYINICYEYGKEISVAGYCKLTGIETQTIYSWANGDTRDNTYFDMQGNEIKDIAYFKMVRPGEGYTSKLSSSHSDLYKKLTKENEESLSAKAISGKGGIGVIAKLNYRHGWTVPQRVVHESSNKPAMSRAEIEQQFGSQALIEGEQPNF